MRTMGLPKYQPDGITKLTQQLETVMASGCYISGPTPVGSA